VYKNVKLLTENRLHFAAKSLYSKQTATSIQEKTYMRN